MSQTDECRTPQAIIWCPLGELDLCNSCRFQPMAVLHLLGSDPLSPCSCAFVRQVGERTMLDLQTLDLIVYLSAGSWDESRSHCTGES